MTLPFQKLPYLVIQLILQKMRFLDLYMLSCTSAKTKRIVKNILKVRSYRLFVGVGEPLVLQIVSGTDEDYSEEIRFLSERKLKDVIPEQEDNVFLVNIGAVANVPSVYIEDDDNAVTCYTFWNNPKFGFNVISDAVSEVFGAKVEEVAMDVDVIPDYNYKIEIDWIENLFPTLPMFAMIGRCSFQDYIWLMKSVRAKKFVLFAMEPMGYPENHEIVNLELKEIEIKHGRWMNLQDIQAIKARSIVVRDISLKDNEINMLLRNLQALKEKSNLKRMNLEFHREANPEIVLEGLNAINEDLMKPKDSLKQWSFKLENGQKCTLIYAEYENDQPDVHKFAFKIRIGN
ncbi:unnamed protein product [Caenorhabditis brenneri]